jgi:hypothetical protein
METPVINKTTKLMQLGTIVFIIPWKAILASRKLNQIQASRNHYNTGAKRQSYILNN